MLRKLLRGPAVTQLFRMLRDGQQDWPENNVMKNMVVSSLDTWNCVSTVFQL